MHLIHKHFQTDTDKFTFSKLFLRVFFFFFPFFFRHRINIRGVLSTLGFLHLMARDCLRIKLSVAEA